MKDSGGLRSSRSFPVYWKWKLCKKVELTRHRKDGPGQARSGGCGPEGAAPCPAAADYGGCD